MLIELFHRYVLRLRRYERILIENRRLAPTRQFDPKFQVEGVAPTNHSSSQKTRLNGFSYGIKIWANLSSVLSRFTRLTDGQTDRILIARPRLHSMQRGKNGFLKFVKIRDFPNFHCFD